MTSSSTSATALNLKVHPLRSTLYEELHSRPSPSIARPCQVTHFTLLLSHGEDLAYVADLCRRFSVPVPAEESSCLYQDFGGFELRWERHMEFANLTFITQNPDSSQIGALAYVPKDWLADMPGELVVALNLVFIDKEPSAAELVHFFEQQRTAGSDVMDEKAKVWTSFKLHSDGFGRVLAYNKTLNPYQCGRFMQRLCEVETYRLMSLLALPLARSTGHDLREAEDKLALLNQKVADIHSNEDERDLLQELSQLAAQVEHYRSASNYRFSAAVAYHDLVNNRLKQLKEAPLEGMQSLKEFLERRLTPGIKTCNSVRDRLEDMSRRITRTTSLLRTRVDLSISQQNQDLLSSMNKRSQVQLRLQQTVEGLSVVAISYYLVSLLGFVYQGLATAGLKLDDAILKGWSAPVVLLAVYWAVRRIRSYIVQKDQ
ncbi:MAG: hypothetical protein RL217_1010 [Pseudomonadota bacterium]|jgi:uncharacterized membrane-anchored protein